MRPIDYYLMIIKNYFKTKKEITLWTGEKGAKEFEIKQNKNEYDKLKEGIEVFGFCGKIGTGKNYIAEQIFQKMMPHKQTAVLAFADQLKIDGIVKLGLERYKCFVKKDEFTRKALQRIGTEEGRDIYGSELWVNYLREWILTHAERGTTRFIISDVRFKNEFDLIANEFNGINVRVEAPERNKEKLLQEAEGDDEKLKILASHISETDLDEGREFDYTINNDPNDNAVIQIRELIKDINQKNKEDLVIFCDVDDTLCKCGIYYEQIIQEVRDLIWTNLNSQVDKEFFNKSYNEAFKKSDGGYYKVFFDLQRFANSLAGTVEEFQDHIRPVAYEVILKEAFRLGMSVFDANYEAIPNRIEELRELQKIAKVVLFTMGDHLEQSKKICQLGIQDLDFEIFDFKDATIFRNLMHKYPAKRYAMIGDSLHRDVLTAKEAGVNYPILMLARPNPFVNYDKADEEGYHVVKNLDEALLYIQEKTTTFQHS